nr:MAG TPA: hypothetical protein [Caudoviricetes sp.]
MQSVPTHMMSGLPNRVNISSTVILLISVCHELGNCLSQSTV